MKIKKNCDSFHDATFRHCGSGLQSIAQLGEDSILLPATPNLNFPMGRAHPLRHYLYQSGHNQTGAFQ
jgi:hypothetical protein